MGSGPRTVPLRGDGWAARSIDESLQQGAGCCVLLWTLMAAGAALVSPVDVARALVVGAHLMVAVPALVVVVRHQRAWPLIATYYLLGLLDLRAVHGLGNSFALTILWSLMLLTGTPTLVLTPPVALGFSAASVGVLVTGCVAFHPDWGANRVTTLVVSALVLCGLGHLLVHWLRARADETDAQERRATDAQVRADTKQLLMVRAAEHARTLHDTLINTLNALAAGVRPDGRDDDLVRAQCSRDVATVHSLLREGSVPAPATPFETLVVPPEMELTSSGPAGAELAAMLPAAAVPVLDGAVSELVRNAVRHSGSPTVHLAVRAQSNAILVTVSDDGSGFDGQPIPGRGLAESVLARLAEIGARVDIDSRPSRGTRITVTLPADGSVGVDADAEPDARRLKRSVCWVWAACIIGFGFGALVLTPPAHPSAELAMLSLLTGLSLASWVTTRSGGTLPRGLVVLVLAGVPISLFTGLWSVSFGRQSPIDLPTFVLTPLLIILLVTTPRAVYYWIGIGLIGATAVACGCYEWQFSHQVTYCIAALVAFELSLVGGLVSLCVELDKVSRRQARLQRADARERARHAAQDAAGAIRSRWLAAGIDSSLMTLQAVADGIDDPRDPRVRSVCARDEVYLRQILQLSPELVQLSLWVARAVHLARQRGVSLVVRGWDRDVPDPAAARIVGELLLACVSALDERHEVVAGLFAEDDGAHLLIVAPAGSFGGVPLPITGGVVRMCTRRSYATQDLIELTVSVRPDAPGDPRFEALSPPLSTG